MKATFNRAVPWVAFPSVLFFALLSHGRLVQHDLPLAITAYLPVLVAAVCVMVLESSYPAVIKWEPKHIDVYEDLWFMGMVQLVLPKLIVLLFIIGLVAPISSLELSITKLWPHHWWTVSQFILMLFTAEFGRYWLHRAMHKNKYLWRLHAVHHSPAKLYWVNVGRFHPIEKAMQMLADTLPFLALGVGENVIGMYFVFYAINGFFQHSNINLRYGILNYIISGAELHRWHHSRVTKESNTNYGNNLIIWDLLFGTWFLPWDRRIEDIGLKNHVYPMKFREQMLTPFVAEITDRPVAFPNIPSILGAPIRILIKFVTRFVDWRQFNRATRTPKQTQQTVLSKILYKNRETQFGIRHMFSSITSYDEFVEHISIQTYETLKPYIEATLSKGDKALTTEKPIFATLTSGTTGTPKYLPVFASTVSKYRQEHRLFIYSQLRLCPEAFAGKILGIVGPAIEGYTDSGLAYGSMSGYVNKGMPPFVRDRYVLPPEVFDIKDYDLKYKIIVRIALQESKITCIATANPSTLLKLLNTLKANASELIESLTTGTLRGVQQLPIDTRHAIEETMQSMPERAAELFALTEENQLGYRQLWPLLRMVITWTGGSCGIAIEALRDSLPSNIHIVELGYLSSEFRGSITIDPKHQGSVPTLHHCFFEFVKKELWEDDCPEYLMLDELGQGEEYYIIVTTSSGLYRYFVNDIVRVTGFYNSTPLIKFMQKGRGVTNITGEKLYEAQLIHAVEKVSQDEKWHPTFFLALADEQVSCYRLYIETDDPIEMNLEQTSIRIDKALREGNIEYDAKRDSGRLLPLKLVFLRAGTGEEYKRFCIQEGQRESQYKPLVLQYQRDMKFFFDDFAIV